MATSSFFSIASAIRIMILGGLLAILFVIVQSCQSPKVGLESYAVGSLKRLQVEAAPPSQPSDVFAGPNGTKMRLSDFEGKTILLNVWATWCAPCIAEMPTLDKLQAELGGDIFQVVIVSLDRTQEEAQTWLDEQGIANLTAYHDSSFTLPSKLNVRGMPISVIYDKYGRERARVAGEADWSSVEALNLINAVKD